MMEDEENLVNEKVSFKQTLKKTVYRIPCSCTLSS